MPICLADLAAAPLASPAHHRLAATAPPQAHWHPGGRGAGSPAAWRTPPPSPPRLALLTVNFRQPRVLVIHWLRL
jgi:hypothetical protein